MLSLLAYDVEHAYRKPLAAVLQTPLKEGGPSNGHSHSASPASSKIILQQIEPIRKQNLKINELVQRLLTNPPSFHPTITTPVISYQQMLIKLIISDLIAPSNGIGLLVSPLQSLLKVSRKLTAECYFYLTKFLVRFQVSTNLLLSSELPFSVFSVLY
jgi:hypothetical protein